ncbi:MAG: BatD family protein [Gammaproteobacteria bacterium]
MLLAWFATALAQASVTAELDRRQAVEGDTVTLILQTDDPQQSLDTDLSVLQADFEVLDQRSETRMSLINGRQSAIVRQVITLEPRRAGSLRVPALSFRGGVRTEPIPLEVEPAPELAPGELPPVFIETEIEPVEGPYYVHAQLSLVVRIFFQAGLSEAAINPPSPEQASVRLLDEKPYRAERNGTRYSVIERSYAIFPERSGTLTIPPMQLTGRLVEGRGDRLWQPAVRGRRVRVESDPLVLEVQPRPPSFQGDSWLPARQVDLAQQITDGESIRVGEPVTRTVILDAVGLEENMLEEPPWPELENARIYPDQPQGISRDDGRWVLGHREFRYAVVPEQAGELVLPEIRLYWWDTVNDRQRVSVLPEHRLQVLPSELSASNLSPSGQTPAGNRASAAAGGGIPGPWAALAAFFAALWLVTLALYLKARRAPGAVAALSPGLAADEEQRLRALREACRTGDAPGARRWLSSWVRHHGPRQAGGSLHGLAERVGDGPLATELERLVAQGFRREGTGEAWDGSALWRAFEDWRGKRGQGPGDGDDGAFDFYAAVRPG